MPAEINYYDKDMMKNPLLPKRTYSTQTSSAGIFNFVLFHQLKNTMIQYTLVHIESIEICIHIIAVS